MTSSGSPSPDVPDDAPALDLDSILRIHRDPDGFIGFVRKPDPASETVALDKHGKPYRFRNVGAVRVGDLKEMFPALVRWITHEAFMTVNAYRRAAPWNNSQTGLPDVWREEKHLRTLTACIVDIDCGRPESDEPGAGLDDWDAITYAGRLVDMGVIPAPSIFARSGRGVYLFWLLHDHKDPAQPQRAWPEKLELYKAVNKALVERLRGRGLPADPRVGSGAQVCRAPGSIHRKSGRPAEYLIPKAGDGKGYFYSLQDLAGFLNHAAPVGDLPAPVRIEAAAPATRYKKTKNEGSAPNCAKGPKMLNAKRAEDLLRLEQYRGGFRKRGQAYDDGSISTGRRLALTLYCLFLRGSGLDQAAALPHVLDMARNARPPLGELEDDQDPAAILSGVYSKRARRYSDKTLFRILKITPDMARDLNLKTIVPPEVRQERRAALPTQADIIAKRREFVRRYVEEHGGRVPPCRAVALAIKAAGLPGGNPQTANQVLNELGFKDQRINKGGRPRKKITPLLEGYEGMTV